MDSGVHNQEIGEQIDKLFSSILTEQRKFNQILSPDSDKKQISEDILNDFSNLRGRDFIYRYLSSGRGHGPFTELADGSVKYDLIGGIGPALLGHSHPLHIKANLEAATVDQIMCGNLLPYYESYDLAKKLLGTVSRSRLKHFWFAGSGSFANDNALKMIWQKKAPKYKVLAFERAFAGRSIATHDITFNSSYREGMPAKIDVDHVPHFDHEDPENSLDKTLNALNHLWEKHGDEYCALSIELVQGEGGFIFGPKDYYRKIFEWAKERGLYIWVDEIQTFGRTRELFAFQQFGLDEFVDVVTVGKALQACGTLFTQELNPNPGLIAGTFNGSIAALKAGKKTLDYLTSGLFYGNDGRSQHIESLFTQILDDLASNSCYNKIHNIRGIGTMISFEVGDSTKETTKAFLHTLFQKGVVAFMAGKQPTRVRFLVPFSITDEHIDEIGKVIEETALESLTS